MEKHAEFACLTCGTDITDEEFEFEDYFTVFRGQNAQTYKAKKDSEHGYLCFDCGNGNNLS